MESCTVSTASETSVADVTFTLTLAATDPRDAVICALPAAIPLACPGPTTPKTVGFEEFQVTAELRS
jgi:hypothetical protein